VGIAAAPVVGPANTVLAVSVANVTAKVPAVVIGEPPTEKMLGIVKPTLVTVPEPEIVVASKAYDQIPAAVVLFCNIIIAR
jgi:hypothetical protein